MKNWQRRALSFEVKAIESILGIKFEGTTLKEKQAFAEKHKAERIAVTGQLLHQAYIEHKRDRNS